MYVVEERELDFWQLVKYISPIFMLSAFLEPSAFAELVTKLLSDTMLVFYDFQSKTQFFEDGCN